MLAYAGLKVRESNGYSLSETIVCQPSWQVSIFASKCAVGN